MRFCQAISNHANWGGCAKSVLKGIHVGIPVQTKTIWKIKNHALHGPYYDFAFLYMIQRRAMLSGEATRNLLICNLWVLKNVDKRILRQWWTDMSLTKLNQLLEVLYFTVSNFEYKVRVGHFWRYSLWWRNFDYIISWAPFHCMCRIDLAVHELWNLSMSSLWDVFFQFIILLILC